MCMCVFKHTLRERPERRCVYMVCVIAYVCAYMHVDDFLQMLGGVTGAPMCAYICVYACTYTSDPTPSVCVWCVCIVCVYVCVHVCVTLHICVCVHVLLFYPHCRRLEG